MIHYSLDAMTEAGISEIAVVVGYQAEKIPDALKYRYPYLTFIYNERYNEGNALSIHAALSFVSDEPFVVCMGDHPISPEIIRCLLSHQGYGGCVLCVDREAWLSSQVNDATRVQVDSDGNITAIGKQLKAWNAIDTGVFKMTPRVFPVIDRLIEMSGEDVGISDVVRFMGDAGETFSTCDVSGMFWADVDTPEDYRTINSLMREKYADGL